MIGKLKNLFGGGPSSSSSSPPTESSTSSPASNDGETTVTPSSAVPEASTPATKEGKNVVLLLWEVAYLSIKPLTASEIRKSRQR